MENNKGLFFLNICFLIGLLFVMVIGRHHNTYSHSVDEQNDGQIPKAIGLLAGSSHALGQKINLNGFFTNGEDEVDEEVLLDDDENAHDDLEPEEDMEEGQGQIYNPENLHTSTNDREGDNNPLQRTETVEKKNETQTEHPPQNSKRKIDDPPSSVDETSADGVDDEKTVEPVPPVIDEAQEDKEEPEEDQEDLDDETEDQDENQNDEESIERDQTESKEGDSDFADENVENDGEAL